MENQTVHELIHVANKIYEQINYKFKNTQPILRLSNALSEIKGSLDELNKLTDEIQWPKSTQQDGVINFIEKQISSQSSSHKNQLLNKKIKKQINLGKLNSVEEKQNKSQAENQSEDKQRSGRGPYRQYTIQTKQSVLQLFRKGLTYSKISKLLKIPSKNIIRWCKNGTTRRPGAGRKVMDPEMENNLIKWIEDTYSAKTCISNEMIRKKAKQLCKYSQFFASHGWFKNFAKRYNLRQKYEVY